MSISFSSRSLVVLLAGILLAPAVRTASAQTLTWGAGGAGGTGQWDAGTTVDWYNGSSNVTWTNGDSAVFAGTAGNVSISGQVTASQATFNTAGYLVQNGFLYGTNGGLTVQTNADATIYSSIFGAGASTTGFTKSGTGLLLLNGGSGPVFFNTATVADGELRYAGATLNTTTPFVLGNTPAAALTFASTIGAVGSLAGGGTAGGVVRPSVTTGSSTLSIYGTSGDAAYAGTLAGNGNATLSLLKGGSSTQTLTNASPSLTGTTTVNAGTLALSGPNGALTGTSAVVLNGGTLRLDNSTDVNAARLASSVPVTLNGGTLSLVGNAAAQNVSQTINTLNIARGASTVSVTSAGTGTTQLSVSTSVPRASGATASFSGGGLVTLSGVSNANGILGGYATVGADWASLNASNGVVAYTGYASDTTTAASTDNLRITSAGAATTSLASVQSRNSLNLVNTGSAAATVDLGANGSLALTSGGLLTSGSSGFVIQNGKLASGNGDLVITNQAALTISSPINSAVTKSGAGTLVLAGANTYTGTTTVNQGTVQVSADANLGGGTTVALNAGTLQATAGFTSTKSLQGVNGTMDTGGNTVAFTGGTNTGSFTKIGTGTLALTGTVGSITVNAGTLQLTNLVGSSTSMITLNNARLEAGINGLQNVTSLGGANAVISPGPHGQAQTLPIGILNVLGQTVVDDDIGSAGHDLISVSSNLTLSGLAPALLFRFNDLGGTQTGVAYPVLQLPSSQFGQFSTSNFGLDSVSMAAGYRGTFTIVNNTEVDVTFSAVPEPSVNAACLCGVLGVWGARTWRRRRTARA